MNIHPDILLKIYLNKILFGGACLNFIIMISCGGGVSVSCDWFYFVQHYVSKIRLYHYLYPYSIYFQCCVILLYASKLSCIGPFSCQWASPLPNFVLLEIMQLRTRLGMWPRHTCKSSKGTASYIFITTLIRNTFMLESSKNVLT